MPRCRKIRWSLVAWLALLAVADRAQGQYYDAVDRFPSDGKLVTIECNAPRLPGRYPAVILLHGSGGLERATGAAFREIAAALAGRGYVTYIPHIFDKTRHKVGALFRDGESEP